MIQQTTTTFKTQFTTELGNHVKVFSTSTWVSNGTLHGRDQVTETFAMVNDTHKVMVDTGRVFMASSRVRNAGF